MDEVKNPAPEIKTTSPSAPADTTPTPQPVASAPMSGSEPKPTSPPPQEPAAELPTQVSPTPSPTVESTTDSKPEPPSAPEPKSTPELATPTPNENLPPPAQPSITEKETAAALKQESAPTLGKKILLVDDDEVFSQLYASVFTSAGYKCIVAEHGLEALDAAKEEQPDLILLDIMMPDINGFEVLKRLKKDPATSQIPVWMLSNLAEQIDRETAANLGAVDYLVKSAHTPKQVCEKIAAYFAGVAPGL